MRPHNEADSVKKGIKCSVFTFQLCRQGYKVDIEMRKLQNRAETLLLSKMSNKPNSFLHQPVWTCYYKKDNCWYMYKYDIIYRSGK